MPRLLPGKRLARSWHRYLGVILALPLLLVGLTGVVLNHTVGLRLDERRVEWGFLLDRYGMRLEGEPVSFAAGEVVVSQWDGLSFLGATPIEAQGRRLLGAVVAGDLVVVAHDALPLEAYQADGLLYAQMDEATFPGTGISRLGSDAQGQAVVEDREGQRYVISPDFFAAEEAAGEETVFWSDRVSTPSEAASAMRAAYRGEGLPWSRVLLDLHSGRIFGGVGPWLLDLSVLGLVLLVITGLKLALRGSRI